MNMYSNCEQCHEFTLKKTLIHKKASNYASQEAHMFAEYKSRSQEHNNDFYFDLYMLYYRVRYINQYELCRKNLIKQLELDLDTKYSNHLGLCSFHSDKVGLIF